MAKTKDGRQTRLACLNAAAVIIAKTMQPTYSPPNTQIISKFTIALAKEFEKYAKRGV